MDQNPQIQVQPITEEERLSIDFPVDGEKVVNVVGAETGEVVMYDKDEQGNVIGWHKEQING